MPGSNTLLPSLETSGICCIVYQLPRRSSIRSFYSINTLAILHQYLYSTLWNNTSALHTVLSCFFSTYLSILGLHAYPPMFALPS